MRKAELAVEKVFYNRNVSSAISTGGVVYICLLAAEQIGIASEQITPQQTKSEKMDIHRRGLSIAPQIKAFVVCLICLLFSAIYVYRGVAEEWMPDVNLRQAVRAQLDLPVDISLTQLEMKRLTGLEAQSRQITDLTGLEHADASDMGEPRWQ